MRQVALESFKAHDENYDKIAKLPSFDTAGEVEAFVRMELEQSCKRLDSDKIDGYMSHEFRDILNARVQEALFEAQSQGRIDKFGASCYDPNEILTARENSATAIYSKYQPIF